MGPPTPAGSFLRTGRMLLAFDYGSMQSSLPLRGFGRLGSSMLVYGMTRPGLLLFALDSVHMGLPLPLRSLS